MPPPLASLVALQSLQLRREEATSRAVHEIGHQTRAGRQAGSFIPSDGSGGGSVCMAHSTRCGFEHRSFNRNESSEKDSSTTCASARKALCRCSTRVISARGNSNPCNLPFASSRQCVSKSAARHRRLLPPRVTNFRLHDTTRRPPGVTHPDSGKNTDSVDSMRSARRWSHTRLFTSRSFTVTDRLGCRSSSAIPRICMS